MDIEPLKGLSDTEESTPSTSDDHHAMKVVVVICLALLTLLGKCIGA